MHTVWYDADLGPQLAAEDKAVANKSPQPQERILDARQLHLDAGRQQQLLSRLSRFACNFNTRVRASSHYIPRTCAPLMASEKDMPLLRPQSSSAKLLDCPL